MLYLNVIIIFCFAAVFAAPPKHKAGLKPEASDTKKSKDFFAEPEAFDTKKSKDFFAAPPKDKAGLKPEASDTEKSKEMCNDCSCVPKDGHLFTEVTEIDHQNFRGCENLVAITAPALVSISENYAFAECPKLIALTLPALQEISGSYAFFSCPSLESVVLPAVTEIGFAAFFKCPSIKAVTAPEVLSIGPLAFFRDHSLVSAHLPKVTRIGRVAFSYTNLENVDAPLLSHIGDNAFFRTQLESICVNNVKAVTTGLYPGVDIKACGRCLQRKCDKKYRKLPWACKSDQMWSVGKGGKKPLCKCALEDCSACDDCM